MDIVNTANSPTLLNAAYFPVKKKFLYIIILLDYNFVKL